MRVNSANYSGDQMCYCIGVASKEHALAVTAGAFAQVCHGKSSPLKQISPKDCFFNAK